MVSGSAPDPWNLAQQRTERIRVVSSFIVDAFGLSMIIDAGRHMDIGRQGKLL